MIRNILLTTLRNFQKSLYFVIINILGLGLALAVCVVGYYNYKYEADFDDIFSKKDQIYRIEMTKETNGRQQAFGMVPASLYPEIKGTLAGVNRMVRYTDNKLSVKYEDHIFDKEVAFADEAFFELFELPILQGDINSFKTKEKALITEDFAQVYFGNEDPMGKIFTIYNEEGQGFTYMVSGVLAKLPYNISFQFDVLLLYDNYFEIRNADEHNWKWWTAAILMEVPDESNIPSIEKLLQPCVKVQNEANKDYQLSGFYIISFDESSKAGRDVWNEWLNSGLHPSQIIAPTVMSILILLLACFNYTNTSIAISSKRLKEIGIRKVVGGLRKQMIIQFLSENIILCFLALTASIFFGQILLAEYNKMWPDINFVMNLSKDYDFWIFLIGLLIFTALFAGAYPAFYISKFDPIPILKGASKFSGTNLFTRILLVIQFTIALVGLISAVIFTQNAKFQETKYLGYNKDEVIVAYTEESRLKPFIDRISQNPQIKTIAETQHHIGWGWYKRTIEYKNEQIETGGYRVGKNYFETLGVLLLEGRFFEERFKSTDEKNSIVVTKKFIDDLGIENPIGERVRMEDTLDLTIVGVIDDFYPYGMWMKVNPVMFRRGNDEHMHTIAVQTDKENVYAINDYMKSEWEKMYPDNPYDGMVQVELMNESKDINKSILKIFIFLALISLLISLIGLYTLISLTVIKKTQEIGIRKVLGSPIHRLIILLNKEFLIIMAFASVFGSISGYYLSEMLLSSIWEVYIDSNAISIIVPVVLLFIISLTTISGKVYYAAIKNPVDAIRYE